MALKTELELGSKLQPDGTTAGIKSVLTNNGWVCCECVKEGGGGVTPIHYLYGYVPPERGRVFEAPDLERGIHFRGVF